MEYPYSDEFMTFDLTKNRYVLTEKDLIENLGIDINQRLKNPNAIKSLLNQISIQVYRFIHEHNINNAFQDFIIAKTCTGREVIRQAMEQQAIYFLTVGDLSRSADLSKRALWFDETAKEILFTNIPEIGTSLLYGGNFPYICTK